MYNTYALNKKKKNYFIKVIIFINGQYLNGKKKDERVCGVHWVKLI